MSDNKLGLALDDIIIQGKQQSHRRSQRIPTIARTGPAGGIQKKQHTPRTHVGAPLARVSSFRPNTRPESKVDVSFLPLDVDVPMLKEYFNGAVGRVKHVEIYYGPDGRSKGKATITFSTDDGASIAFKELDNLLIDGKPIKVEIVVAGDKAAATISKPLSLSERAQPLKQKVQPKSAANNKHKNEAKTPQANKGGKKVQARRNARPSKKTAEELDSEMVDYFQAEVDADANAPAADGADAAMDEEVL